MPKNALLFATFISVLIVVGLLGVSSWRSNHELEKLRGQMSELLGRSDQQQSTLSDLTNQLAESKGEIDRLEREKDETSRKQRSLEKEMRDALESRDVTISQLQGKLTVNILDRILFDSGEAVLKPEGEKLLQKIGGILNQYPNRQIHVIGHTDNVPIRSGPKARFATNWELSTARATAAVRFLCEKAGADARRLGAVGYGEFHPIAENTTAEGRARNRRIALVVLPEELAGSDIPSAVRSPGKPVPVTNSVPGVQAEIIE